MPYIHTVIQGNGWDYSLPDQLNLVFHLHGNDFYQQLSTSEMLLRKDFP